MLCRHLVLCELSCCRLPNEWVMFKPKQNHISWIVFFRQGNGVLEVITLCTSTHIFENMHEILLIDKQWSYLWFDTPRRSCNVTIMNWVHIWRYMYSYNFITIKRILDTTSGAGFHSLVDCLQGNFRAAEISVYCKWFISYETTTIFCFYIVVEIV